MYNYHNTWMQYGFRSCTIMVRACTMIVTCVASVSCFIIHAFMFKRVRQCTRLISMHVRISCYILARARSMFIVYYNTGMPNAPLCTCNIIAPEHTMLTAISAFDVMVWRSQFHLLRPSTSHKLKRRKWMRFLVLTRTRQTHRQNRTEARRALVQVRVLLTWLCGLSLVREPHSWRAHWQCTV